MHGFIFDLDGALTDTAEYHYQGWQRLGSMVSSTTPPS
jgi:beta-phosphoglucomutase